MISGKITIFWIGKINTDTLQKILEILRILILNENVKLFLVQKLKFSKISFSMKTKVFIATNICLESPNHSTSKYIIMPLWKISLKF